VNTAVKLRELMAQFITPESFQPYGQVIFPCKDDKIFDYTDAQLSLENGITRFYIMRLKKQGTRFHKITRHVECTQCLGSLEGKDWFMAVCPPENNNREPILDKLVVFHIPANCFIKLEVGTWHAGPYFYHDFVDFYNLELSDTNLVDHFTHDFLKTNGLTFQIVL